MREIAAIAVVVGLALLGMLPGLRRLRSALGLEHFVSSGHVFLILGIALGPVGVGLLDDATLAALEPVTIFLLAWMGLIVGLRMEVALLRRVERRSLTLAAVGATLPAILVPLGLVWLTGIRAPGPLLIAAGCAGATAATAATWLLRGQRTGELALVHTAAALDDWAIVALAIPAFALAHSGGTHAGLMVVVILVAAGVIGTAVALLLPHLRQAGEELVVGVGAAALAGGGAAYVGLSSVVAGAVAGLVVANAVRGRRGTQPFYALVTRVERPFYLAFVVLTGATLTFARPDLWVPLFLVFVAGRALGKLAGGFVARRLTRGRLHPLRLAAVSLPMAPLALAVAADLATVHPGLLTRAVLVAVALAWLVFEVGAAVLAPRGEAS